MIEVREAMPSELGAAGQVVAEAYLALPGARRGPYLERVADAAGRASACTVLVAVEDHRVLGSVSYVADSDNPYADVVRPGEAGFRMLGVAVAEQGRGIGRRLVDACLDLARRDGRTAVAIATSTSMTRAHSLYEQAGFRRAPDRDFEPVAGVALWAFVRPLREPAPAPNVRPAATVVVMRPGPDGPEVLLTQRPSTMAFAPGLHVFPGGAVDADDADPWLLDRLRTNGSEPASHAGPFMVAAIRELYEEAGLLLATRRSRGARADRTRDLATAVPARGRPFVDTIARADLELRGDWLVPLSRWVTPPPVARRFDARFFVAQLPDGAVPAFDRGEVVGHAWLTPRDALSAMADGELLLWPPTSTTLQQLTHARGIADVRDHLTPSVEAHVQDERPPRGPRVDRPAPGVTRARVAGAGAIDGQSVNVYLVGKRRLAVVDPGDPSDVAIGGLLRLATEIGGRVAAVLLTAPVPDHAAGIESLALRLGVPIRAADGASRLLASTVEPVADGTGLDVADVPIRALVTPGTSPDHLAFDLPTADAVLVGDLEGPRPERSIPEPVDEAQLARSRARVDGLGRAHHLAAHG
jgi:8-oxo-dGTP pyrophosphatase MutT (NUDIX family)/glyoxylase-like metal-dependent hydrolase (beta-lactamase superfamily II)/ribosomal protein S18 acetylase RimI-like enzyme